LGVPLPETAPEGAVPVAEPVREVLPVEDAPEGRVTVPEALLAAEDAAEDAVEDKAAHCCV